MKIVGVLLFLLLAGSGAQAADCETHLEVKRFDQVIVRMLRAHLNEIVTIRMRMHGEEELNFATLRARVENVSFISVTPDGRTIDFSIRGKGRQIALSLIALTDPEVMGSAITFEWLRDRKPLRAEPLPLREPTASLEGDDLLRMVRRSVRTLDLPVRVLNLLLNDPQYRIRFIGDLIERNDEELLRIHTFGSSRLREVEAALAEKGLRLNMSVPPWRQRLSGAVMEFLEMGEPVIPLEEWVERTPEKNRRTVRDGNYNMSEWNRAVTILTESGIAKFAVMQFSNFSTAKGYGLALSIRRSLEYLSQHRPASFYQRIFDWQRKEMLLPRLSIAQISGERGYTLLSNAFATDTPIVAGSEEGQAVALIFLPLDTE